MLALCPTVILLPAVRLRVLEREPDDPARARDADRLHGDTGVRRISNPPRLRSSSRSASACGDPRSNSIPW